MFLNSQNYHRAKCKDLTNQGRVNDRIYERQLGIHGFDLQKFQNLRLLMIGAGGINGEIGEGLVRKGIGELVFVDADTVSLSNLNRQQFYQKDIGKPKAIRLVQNLVKNGFMGTKLQGYPEYAQNYLELDHVRPDLVVCGVDNDETRVYISKYGIYNSIPVIFTAVSRDANHGYVFIQEPKKACFACSFPNSLNNYTTPCPNTPALKDILKIVAGIALYAIDAVLLDRHITWNYRMIYLAGYMADQKLIKGTNLNCELCSKGS